MTSRLGPIGPDPRPADGPDPERRTVRARLGRLVSGVGFCLVGQLAAESYERVAAHIGEGAALVCAVPAITALVVWHMRRRRSEHEAEELDGDGVSDPP